MDLESRVIDISLKVASLEEKVNGLTTSIDKLTVVISTHVAAEVALGKNQSDYELASGNRLTALEQKSKDIDQSKDRKIAILVGFGGALLAAIGGGLIERWLAK